MAESDSTERTFPATPLQLERARQRGQVAVSADLAAPLALLAGAGAMLLAGPSMLAATREMVARCLGSAEQAGGVGAGAMLGPALLAGAACLGVAIVTALAGLAQTGWLWTAAGLGPRWDRVNPFDGLRRVASGPSWVRMGLGLAKLLAVGWVLWRQVAADLAQLTGYGGDLDGLVGLTGRCAVRLALWLAAVLGGLAVVDLLYQRWQFRQDLRMSRRDWLEDMRRMNRRPAARARRQETA